MTSPPTGIRGALSRLTHVGVDPSLPRSATRHVVLTNAYALFVLAVFVLSVAGSELTALRMDVRIALSIGAVLSCGALALNAARRHWLASTWLLIVLNAVFVFVGTHEPEITEHEGVLTLTAVVAFFLYGREHQRMPVLWLVVSVIGVVWMRAMNQSGGPDQLPGFDAYTIGTNNLVVVVLTLAFFSHRAVAEIATAEDDLVEEKKKTETLLKREVAHQVAERSRELGSVLASGPGTTPSLAGSARFGSRYRVLRTLGEGGMGAVVEVERVTDGARLALKVMTGAVTREQAARFAREAEIGARVHHANLVAIVDVGVAEGGAPYLVMELAAGSIESQRARFGDVRWALDVLRQMAAGLVALHEAGVVHRDLKPANVLVDATGIVKLSDFGIARMGAIPMGAVDPDAPTASPARGSALTGTGAWIGTPLYMAPEAARGGRDVGPSVDVFAFGLVAHELITGALPFATPPVLLALVAQSLPVVTPLAREGLDARVASLLDACLAEDPSARPTAKVLSDALSR